MRTPARLLSSYDRLVDHLGGHQVGDGPGGCKYVKRASSIHRDIVYRSARARLRT